MRFIIKILFIILLLLKYVYKGVVRILVGIITCGCKNICCCHDEDRIYEEKEEEFLKAHMLAMWGKPIRLKGEKEYNDNAVVEVKSESEIQSDTQTEGQLEGNKKKLEVKNEYNDGVVVEVESESEEYNEEYHIDLRNYCRKHGFEKKEMKIENNRYSDFSGSFSNYSQKLRIVGMSYDRTMFAGAFLGNGKIDEEYIKENFVRTFHLFFDDGYYFTRDFDLGRDIPIYKLWINRGSRGKKILLFRREIEDDLDSDLTLSENQKITFMHYLDKHHGKLQL
jgi:hypothetical protein